MRSIPPVPPPVMDVPVVEEVLRIKAQAKLGMQQSAKVPRGVPASSLQRPMPACGPPEVPPPPPPPEKTASHGVDQSQSSAHVLRLADSIPSHEQQAHQQ